MTIAVVGVLTIVMVMTMAVVSGGHKTDMATAAVGGDHTADVTT